MSTLEEEIHHHLIQKGLTLSCAESCSGGSLAFRFVQQADSSKYFLGSLVAYSNQAKINLLGVDSQVIENEGAVSESVAHQMVLGALKSFQSDYALSITGIAGPSGGTPSKPVGTVCFGLAFRDVVATTWTCHFHGDRLSIIQSSVGEALHHLHDHVTSLS